MTWELKYEVDEQKIIIQDHSAGHTFGQGGI
ncbi:HNH/endonuclease VII fold putative polymorphic toxin [Bacillus wiedmannii]|nr:HNH/endonuclease VII fold putative polymorphic toxin [Bacillus wiedmannii]MDF9663807.1 HNH/endonuclease VII fold putative polymorphic toxin [Bacillus wiedmannii]MDI6504882.1 HNH/endonuclease VII fold putative polymorphic toxin [Bacillus wiedmannii]MDI6510783.1 HNH/endonuclease VII fold putative polymorphic toxin [Bacillus wiedmannii]